MNGKLYGLGVGPGDPELMTLKAKRILNAAGCIAIPKTSAEKKSQALAIAEGVLEGEKSILELHFPMSFDGQELEDSWEAAAKQVEEVLETGTDVAFITLGDPTVYSTYIYLHKLIRKKGFETEIVPGVTSFCASAARAGISLGEGDESIAVVPGAYECENLEEILDTFDNVVVMKAVKSLPVLKKLLAEKGLEDKAVLVSKCGFPDERVHYGPGLEEEGKMSYFTTMIIKRGGL